MSPKKIGAFLQALRKEKGFTQEQLAQHFNVSNRTISRWETGTNIPDISLLVEIAEFYSVDIREIIDGERKNENMNEEIKDVAIKMADYADTEKKVLLKRVKVINIIGLIIGFIPMFLSLFLTQEVFFYKMLRDVTAGFTVGVIICNLLYTTGLLEKARERASIKRVLKLVSFVAFIVIALCLSIAAIYTWIR